PSWRATGAWARPCPRPPRPAASRAAPPAAGSAPRRAAPAATPAGPNPFGRLADRIEDNLSLLLVKAEEILRDNERYVLAMAHALETHKTLSGEDVTAVFEGGRGPLVNGAPYGDDAFIG